MQLTSVRVIVVKSNSSIVLNSNNENEMCQDKPKIRSNKPIWNKFRSNNKIYKRTKKKLHKNLTRNL